MGIIDQRPSEGSLSNQNLTDQSSVTHTHNETSPIISIKNSNTDRAKAMSKRSKTVDNLHVKFDSEVEKKSALKTG
jgi:hypothetical protein